MFLNTLLQHHADVFGEQARRRGGRQAGKHTKMLVDPAKLKGVTIGGRRAGKVIEKLVRRGGGGGKYSI